MFAIFSFRNTYDAPGLNRWQNNADGSTVAKMQHKYWVTKQQVCKKLGKKDDEFIVASDAELDAKLELFKSIRGSCQNLQRIVNKYDEKIYSKYFVFVYDTSILYTENY